MYKIYILECINYGGDYGECKTQIKEFLLQNDIMMSDDEIEKMIIDMLTEELIISNPTWENEKGETPYVITDKGKEYLSSWIN